MQPVSGLDAFVGLYRGKAKGVGAVRIRAAHVVVGRQVFMVAGVAPEAEFARIDADFTAALASFRELSSSEAAAIRPNRVEPLRRRRPATRGSRSRSAPAADSCRPRVWRS